METGDNFADTADAYERWAPGNRELDAVLAHSPTISEPCSRSRTSRAGG
jgi:hypothetical protein